MDPLGLDHGHLFRRDVRIDDDSPVHFRREETGRFCFGGLSLTLGLRRFAFICSFY